MPAMDLSFQEHDSHFPILKLGRDNLEKVSGPHDYRAESPTVFPRTRQESIVWIFPRYTRTVDSICQLFFNIHDRGLVQKTAQITRIGYTKACNSCNRIYNKVSRSLRNWMLIGNHWQPSSTRTEGEPIHQLACVAALTILDGICQV